jgi:hypothetical protein
MALERRVARTKPVVIRDGLIAAAGDSTEFVEFWARMGATFLKAYIHVTRAELKAAIDAAHARWLKVTGHLCSVGFREMAGAGYRQFGTWAGGRYRARRSKWIIVPI